VSFLRALKREFWYYCIELVVEQPAEPAQLEKVYVIGGLSVDCYKALSSMERFDAVSGQWSTAADSGTTRQHVSACVITGEIYVTGGISDFQHFQLVEKYSPLSDSWIAVALMLEAQCNVAVAVGSVMYAMGGDVHGSGVDVFKLDSTQGTWTEGTPDSEKFMRAQRSTWVRTSTSSAERTPITIRRRTSS
jgi:hypothetical protein